ncbi:MAG TPA: hypothetical protein VIF82_17935 [Burkholderiaceae bacterium]|jgi:hypothetical protein
MINSTNGLPKDFLHKTRQYISSSSQINKFVMARESQDRRKGTDSALPYITEEGLVMVDRRENIERRTVQRLHQHCESLRH